jgi:hypothetical protein
MKLPQVIKQRAPGELVRRAWLFSKLKIGKMQPREMSTWHVPGSHMTSKRGDGGG